MIQNVEKLDGNIGWFDGSKATKYEETTTWNGNNHISDATGSQWEHETLYHTASGRWILHHSSQWQGTIPTYREITADIATQWLVRCGYHDSVPQDILAELEI